MRYGFFGAIVAMATGAGVGWGQVPPTLPSGPTPTPPYGFPLGGSPIIPPQMGITTPNPSDPANFPPGGDPGAVGYPTPVNTDAFDPNGPGGYTTRGLGRAPCVWFNAEYLMWFQKAAHFNYPVVTTGSPLNNGVIGNADTHVLYGNNDVNFNLTSGFRLSGGMYFDAERRVGLELSGFLLEEKDPGFHLSSAQSGGPVIARPYFDPSTGTNHSMLITSPLFASGGIAVGTSSKTWGAEGNLVYNLYRSSPTDPVGYTLTFLGGFRYAEHDEAVNIQTSSNLLNGASVSFLNQTYTANTGTTTTYNAVGSGFNQVIVQTVTVGNTTVNLASLDQLKASNKFYGANLGLFQELRYGRWTVGLTGKVALGVMDETVQILGGSNLTEVSAQTQTVSAFNTFTNTFGNPQTTTLGSTINNVSIGGLQALSDSIGKYHRDVFAVLPEGTITVGYQITPGCSAFLGYNVLYMNRVVRPTNLVTGSVNPALLPTSSSYGSGAVAPAVNVFKESDFWVQGVNFGFSIKY